MKQAVRKRNLGKVIFTLIAVASVFAFAGDVVVQEGVIEGVKFKSTGCTVTGTGAVAFGDDTDASGNYSTASGWLTTASNNCSVAMGCGSTASGVISTAMGNGTTASGNSSTAMGAGATASGQASIAMGYSVTAGPASGTSAIGSNFTNNNDYSFAVGFGLRHCC